MMPRLDVVRVIGSSEMYGEYVRTTSFAVSTAMVAHVKHPYVQFLNDVDSWACNDDRNMRLTACPVVSFP
jgi:hypothetical protein